MASTFFQKDSKFYPNETKYASCCRFNRNRRARFLESYGSEVQLPLHVSQPLQIESAGMVHHRNGAIAFSAAISKTGGHLICRMANRRNIQGIGINPAVDGTRQQGVGSVIVDCAIDPVTTPLFGIPPQRLHAAVTGDLQSLGGFGAELRRNGSYDILAASRSPS